MSLKERTYSVLIVSAAEKTTAALSSLLSDSKYSPVRTVTNISAAKREWYDRAYDYVIINSPLPDDAGIRFSIDLAEAKGTVVLLLVRGEVYDDILDQVVNYGVFVVPKPLSRSVIISALDWMASAREKLRRLEVKTLTIEEKMEEIRLVNRAKWILISNLSLDEPQAHRYIEKNAMDRCMSKRDIAEEIIKTYS